MPKSTTAITKVKEKPPFSFGDILQLSLILTSDIPFCMCFCFGHIAVNSAEEFWYFIIFCTTFKSLVNEVKRGRIAARAHSLLSQARQSTAAEFMWWKGAVAKWWWWLCLPKGNGHYDFERPFQWLFVSKVHFVTRDINFVSH